MPLQSDHKLGVVYNSLENNHIGMYFSKASMVDNASFDTFVVKIGRFLASQSYKVDLKCVAQLIRPSKKPP